MHEPQAVREVLVTKQNTIRHLYTTFCTAYMQAKLSIYKETSYVSLVGICKWFETKQRG